MGTRAADVQELLKKVEKYADGWRIEERAKCYLMIPPLDAPNPRPVSIPKSPNGRRMLANARADLRRRGFDPDATHEAIARAIEDGDRTIVEKMKTIPRVTKEEVEIRLNGQPIHANGAPTNGHKTPEPVTVLERQPAPGYPGVVELLLSNDTAAWGCAMCPTLTANTISEAVKHHGEHCRSIGHGRRPTTDLVADVIRDDIHAGRYGWVDSAELPTGQELADRFGVSQYTSSRAIRILGAEGLVDIGQGRRVKVTYRPTTTPAQEPTVNTSATPATIAAAVNGTSRAEPADPAAAINQAIALLQRATQGIAVGTSAKIVDLETRVVTLTRDLDQTTARAVKAETELAALKSALAVFKNL